jgi:coenzyme F420-reducing hydrogenase beta subunit
MLVAEVGVWKVHKGNVVSDDGVDEVTVITDGVQQMFSGADPKDLMIALARFLNVFSFEADKHEHV